jgi:hypothetical protein
MGGKTMGIIFDYKVEETQIMSAYGLIVYGKINKYDWMGINNYGMENALVTFRIVDNSGNDIFYMNMGNNCILQCRIDDTLDNFLWWIVKDHPDKYTIENQVYKSLCKSDCLFNYSISNRKAELRRVKEEKKRIEEAEKIQQENKDRIVSYCDKKGLISLIDYDDVYIIKTHTEKAYNMLKTCNMANMRKYIAFMKNYPENADAFIMKSGTMEEILDYIA